MQLQEKRIGAAGAGRPTASRNSPQFLRFAVARRVNRGRINWPTDGPTATTASGHNERVWIVKLERAGARREGKEHGHDRHGTTPLPNSNGCVSQILVKYDIYEIK